MLSKDKKERKVRDIVGGNTIYEIIYTIEN